jgi:hypothetical protein
LHLDAWGVLNYADGYKVSFLSNKTAAPTKNEEPLNLYFLNLGGYDSKQFTELHHNVFIVAKDKQAAKLKAKDQISHWEVPHQDTNFEVEHIISVADCLKDSPFNLLLTKSNEIKEFKFTCKYVPIGEAKTKEVTV